MSSTTGNVSAGSRSAEALQIAAGGDHTARETGAARRRARAVVGLAGRVRPARTGGRRAGR